MWVTGSSCNCPGCSGYKWNCSKHLSKCFHPHWNQRVLSQWMLTSPSLQMLHKIVFVLDNSFGATNIPWIGNAGPVFNSDNLFIWILPLFPTVRFHFFLTPQSTQIHLACKKIAHWQVNWEYIWKYSTIDSFLLPLSRLLFFGVFAECYVVYMFCNRSKITSI